MPQSLTTLQSTALGPVLTASGVSPTVAVTTIAYPGIVTAADPAGGETITVTGTGFNAGVKVYVGSTICTTTYVSATSLTFVTPANSVGSYVLYVYNTDGTNGASPAGITYSAIPVWVTASGALTGATLDASYSTSVSATGDSITYSVTTGSLPTGLSLNASTGAITGTPTVEATSTFSITATDAQNQAVARSFSIAVVAVVSLDYLVVAGGGGGGCGYYGGGGGAGGYRTAANYLVNPGSAITVTVGSGGTASGSVSVNGTNGSNSVFEAITSIGGGGGASRSTSSAGNSGGSGGGASFQDFLGGAGTAGQGNRGGNLVTGEFGGSGGGAGAAGTGASNGVVSPGGIGLASSISGTSTYYAGGGGGGKYGVVSAGGLGGGGAGGAAVPFAAAVAGTANTGGGGGGGGDNAVPGANGGSGVVILRFLSTVTPAGTTGSPTITTDGSYSVYKFTASGSITF